MSGLPQLHLSSSARTIGHWLPRTYSASAERDPFDLDAPYQRGSIWTLDQRVALIKSLYMGLPVGTIIVSVLPFRKGNPYSYRVVDGKQRVETVRMFAADEFAIPSAWLRDDDAPPRPVDEWASWSDMSDRFHRWFDMGAQLPALEFKPDEEWMGRDASGKGIWRSRSDAEILRAEAELFALINGGGTPQTEDDMARAALIAEGVR